MVFIPTYLLRLDQHEKNNDIFFIFWVNYPFNSGIKKVLIVI